MEWRISLGLDVMGTICPYFYILHPLDGPAASKWPLELCHLSNTMEYHPELNGNFLEEGLCQWSSDSVISIAAETKLMLSGYILFLHHAGANYMQSGITKVRFVELIYEKSVLCEIIYSVYLKNDFRKSPPPSFESLERLLTMLSEELKETNEHLEEMKKTVSSSMHFTMTWSIVC